MPKNCDNKISISSKKFIANKKGVSIIEILIVVVIVTIALVSLLGAVAKSLKTSILTKQNNQAKELAQEALEAVRSFRDGTDWVTDGLGSSILYIPGASYYPCRTDDIICKNPPDALPEWNLVSGEETIGIFIRKIVLSKISRDPTTKNIESIYNPANNDPNSRKITATISWQGKTLEISTLLTNWK